MHAPIASPSPESPEPFDPAIGQRPLLKLHRGRPDEDRTARPQAEAWPLHSLDTVLASLLVTSAAAGWIVVAVAASAPMARAGEWLGRVAGASERA